MRKQNKIAFQQRIGKDIWEGLYEFPLFERKNNTSTQELLKELGPNIVFRKEFQLKKHVLSHQNIYATVIEVEMGNNNSNYTYYTKEEIQKLPKSILMENYLQKNIF